MRGSSGLSHLPILEGRLEGMRKVGSINKMDERCYGMGKVENLW